MNLTKNNQILILIGAIVVSLLLGFGIASWKSSRSTATGTATDKASNTDARPEQAGDANANQEDSHAEKDADDELVKLTPEQITAAGIDIVAVTRGGGASTRLSGRVEPKVGARAAVAAAVGGRIERVLVAPGARVGVGTPIAVIVSGDGATMRASADAALAEAQAARLSYVRDSKLVGQGVVARQEMEATRARAMAAEANSRAALARIAAAGTPDARGRIRITSPVPGVISTVQVTPGGFVAAGEVIANVANPAQTEIVFSAAPVLASTVSNGMHIEVTGPEGSFPAIVTGVAADVNEPTGMTLIRAQHESGRLPPSGSAVSGMLLSGGSDTGITVPADAIQTVEGQTVVFVAVDGGFRPVKVMVGRRGGDRVEVLSGLQGNERVVGANAFLLKAELGKGAAEHGH